MLRKLAVASACLSALIVASAPARAADTRQPNTVTIFADYAFDCFMAAEFNSGNSESCDQALLRPMSNKTRASTFGNRSALRLQRKNYSGALEDCDAALKVDSSVPEIYLDRGAALIMLQRSPEAIDDLDMAIMMDTRRIHFAYYNRAVAKEATGDVRGAYEDYRKALEIEPNFPQAQEQLKRFRVVEPTSPS